MTTHGLRYILLAGALSAFGTSATAQSSTQSPAHGSFTVGDGRFLLNGDPYTVKAAELHYPRIPRGYWDNRIKLCKALGMNTICMYVFWNVHESRPGEFDFSGQNDIRAFVELCRDNGMNVIVRPGPYVCAEWEMGGLPWWLLKKGDIRLRENDSYFLERVDIFQKAVAEQLKGLTVAEGGPIIMVQVENEYGSYGEDKEYIANIRDMLRRNFGEDVTLFQCDWASNFTLNGLDDLVWTMNFGTGANIDEQFRRLRELRPQSPLMCSEFWSGWFDKWGVAHETRPADEMIAGIDEMLSKDISFSLYMTHGGTNWGHWAGANSPGFAPDVTSYDYDAPISESGQTTPKYDLLRATMAKHNGGEPLPPVPPTIGAAPVGRFSLLEFAPLFDALPEPKRDRDIRTMEEYDQGFGSIIYSTTLPEVKEGATLTVSDPHDFAQVFVDGRYVGKLDRRLGEKTLTLPAFKPGAKLDILVEALGRINFGRAIKDFKGITEGVTLTDGATTSDLKDWTVYNINDEYSVYTAMLDEYGFSPFSSDSAKSRFPGPDADGRLPRGVYRGTFNVTRPADTFLDFSTWGKGLVYVNGHPLGRIWEIGPQQTLYTPGCWLNEGRNELLVFDIVGPREASVRGLDRPLLDELCDGSPRAHRQEGETIDLAGLIPVAEGELAPGNGWQEIKLTKPVRGRLLCLEALDAIDGGDLASVAEIYVTDTAGNRLPREGWRVIYADSEDLDGVNRGADKTFDLQESTAWATRTGDPYPHLLVIDLGADTEVQGLQILPRMEQNVPGAIKGYRIYMM